MVNRIKNNPECLPFYHHRKESLIFFAILLSAMLISLTCAFKTTKKMEIVVDTNTNQLGGPKQTYKVEVPLMATVGEIVQDQHIEVQNDCYIDKDMDTRAIDIDQISIVKKLDVTINVDGNQIHCKTASDRVIDILNDNGISLSVQDEVTPSRYALVSFDSNIITVTRIEYKIETRENEVAFDTVEQENDELKTGTQNVITDGMNGVEMLTERVTYRDGVAAERAVLIASRIKEPVTQVIEVGTAGGKITGGHPTGEIGDEMDFICAVVAQEGGHSYEGALAVISCIMNRVDSGRWGGSTAVEVIQAPGQFSAYLDGDYVQYLGAELPEVRQAVTDCMEGGKRSHPYESFRGYPVEGGVQYGGNYFF